MAVLTEARRAVWQAIDNWPALSNAFAQKVRYDRELSMLDNVEPSISDLPAIAIAPVSNVPDWFLNRVQHWVYLLDLTIWTPDWVLEPAEDLLEKTMDALYRSRPNAASGPTYLETYLPFKTLGTASIQAINLTESEGPQVMKTTITISLSIRKAPFGNP